MPLSKNKQPDQRRIVARLAAEFQLPIEDVSKLYEHAHAELLVGAHVTKFLHIFAIRHVEAILRKRVIENLASLAADRKRLADARLLTPVKLPGSSAPKVTANTPRP